jgi:endo-1,4-beta-xylanase
MSKQRLTAILTVLAALMALIALIAVPAASAHNSSSARVDLSDRGLRDLGALRGLYIGTAVAMDHLSADPTYRSLTQSEFSSVTAENVMKWEEVEPQRGVDDFTEGDRLLRFAKRNNQSVYGHNVLWHNQLPPWLTTGVSGGTIDKQQLKSILRRHTLALVGHYRGKVRAWDVTNEIFNDDGNATTPATWRNTIWYQAFGTEYVEWVLRWARQADPRTKLYLNDYNNEGLGGKSLAYYNLAKELKRKHVPIDGIGAQAHLSLMYGHPAPGEIKKVLQRFAGIGLDIAFTEVDVRIPVATADTQPTAAQVTEQTRRYRDLIDSCLAVRRCNTFTLWGHTDKYSWVPGWFTDPPEGYATPFSASYEAKPAYWTLREALAG